MDSATQIDHTLAGVDPFDDANLRNPLPLHEALREAGRVVYLDRYDVYAMARYADVHAALRDWQTFESGAGVGLSNFRVEKPWRPPSVLLEADPPHHDAPRAAVASILSSRRLHGMRESWKTTAHRIVDELLSGTVEFDAVAELATRFPLSVFPDAVGLGDDGRDHLLPYGDFAFNAFGPHNDRVTGAQDTVGAHAAWVGGQCKRDTLGDGGFGAQIYAAADRGDISDEQAPMIVRSLLTAGVDTTVHAISALLYSLATHPEALALLRRSPDLARTAFDEAIRLESPVQTFFRTATRDVQLDGTVIPAGKKILMFLGAANRDPRHWTQPDLFDLGRDPSGHVGFGMGIHQCVGQHVARLEAVCLLEALLPRISAIELAGEPRRHLNNTLRAWDTLPVKVTRA